jgi:gluconate kinase
MNWKKDDKVTDVHVEETRKQGKCKWLETLKKEHVSIVREVSLFMIRCNALSQHYVMD